MKNGCKMKWEYRKIQCDYESSDVYPDLFLDDLNALGEMGWELQTITMSHVLDRDRDTLVNIVNALLRRPKNNGNND